MNENGPAGSGDHTIIRPNPGGRSRASPVSANPTPPPVGAQPPLPASGTVSGTAAFQIATSAGLSPLLRAAVPTLLLATGLRGAREHGDVPGLYADAVRQVQTFEKTAQALGVPQESLLAARYALCTFLDEVVMNTPWGAASEWANSPLLLTFHRETHGGDKFFHMVDRVLADTAPRHDLIEFFYVCLSLGFAGRYRIAPGGANTLLELRDRLYARIRDAGDPQPGALSLRWQGVQDRRHRLVRDVPSWVLGALALLILGSLFLNFHHGLTRAVAPVTAQLNTIQRATFEFPVPAPTVTTAVTPAAVAAPPRPTLPELLKGEDTSRLEISSEPGGVTRLTLTGEVFASASVEVTEGFVSLLVRIGDALEQVDGRLMVEGHSDDLPIRSLRFKDNHELSRARARSAAEIVRTRLSDPGRVQYSGLGSDRPRYQPASDPDNRARNRRVELIHRPDGAGQ